INEQYAARAARFLAWTGTPWRVPARELGRSVPSGFIVWITVQLIHSPEGLRPQDTGRTTMSTSTMHGSPARSAIRQEPKRSHGRGRQATAATHAGADRAGGDTPHAGRPGRGGTAHADVATGRSSGAVEPVRRLAIGGLAAGGPARARPALSAGAQIPRCCRRCSRRCALGQRGDGLGTSGRIG